MLPEKISDFLLFNVIITIKFNIFARRGEEESSSGTGALLDFFFCFTSSCARQFFWSRSLPLVACSGVIVRCLFTLPLRLSLFFCTLCYGLSASMFYLSLTEIFLFQTSLFWPRWVGIHASPPPLPMSTFLSQLPIVTFAIFTIIASTPPDPRLLLECVLLLGLVRAAFVYFVSHSDSDSDFRCCFSSFK